MKGILSILIILMYSFLSNAQNYSYEENLTQLEEKLDATKNVNAKLEIYMNIIELSFPDHQDNVLKYANELIPLAESLNNTNAHAFGNYYVGEYYFNKDHYEKADKYYRKALQLYKSLDNKIQILLIYHNLGLSNQYLNNYDEALVFYQDAVKIAESIGSKEREAVSLHDIGTLYNDLEKYSFAQYYYQKALKIYIELDNTERIAAIYQNFGVLHYNWGDFVQSLDYYQKSLKIYEELNDKQSIAISLSNIGLVYEESKNFKMALDYYQRALIIFEEIDFKPTLVYIFYNLGSIYRNLENYDKSIEYFEKGLDLSIEISMKDYISYNYEALSAIYEETGKYYDALNYYKEYVIIKDSLFNEEKHLQISELEAEFQTAQHEKQIEFLKLDQELQESKLKKKESQNLILILSAFLAVVIAFILLFFARSQKKLSGKLQNEVEERIKSEEQLRLIKEQLELRVKERTVDIEESNKKLLKEIEEHKSTMKSLELAKNKAVEADKIKSNFLANISHEIRTPMNAITGYSQMLAYTNITTKKRNNYITLVQEGCVSLTNLIDDIVDFAAVESGQATIEKKEFNPHPVLEFLYDHYTNELVRKKKENLILSYANENSESDLQINSDPSRFKQILSILIDNALKFTEKGHIEFGFTHPNESEIQFFVRDTGIGIDSKNYDLIFERFRQVDDSTTKKYGGTGIGLSVAKKLTELLGGEITLESTVGKGSTFFVKLPFNSNLEEPGILQPVEFDWSGKVILVAEDKKINFEIINETLSITNAQLVWAKNGKEAVQQVELNPKIDLVLMDIQMPVMDGYESTRRIKEITKNIPVIAQTAYALPQDSYKCFDAGCDDYISKPISLNQFLLKLNKYLS